MPRFTLFLIAGALFLLNAKAASIEVSAGDIERINSIVRFPSASKNLQLLDGSASIPVQVRNGQATFILPKLGKGQKRTFKLAEKAAAQNAIVIEPSDTRLDAHIGENLVFSYQAEPAPFPRDNIKQIFARGGYLHPVRTPSGRTVTDDYPTNHIHHHGIWHAWTKTSFEGRDPDFWNMGQAKGRVEHKAINEIWPGPVHAGFVSTMESIDLMAGRTPAEIKANENATETPLGKAVLNETWTVTAYAIKSPFHVFDLVTTHTTASDAPLKLPEYHYGGMGFRGAWAWNGAANTFYLTSEGIDDRVKAHATRARWCYVGGDVRGERAGIVIMCAPENFRAPQPVRVHPTEPFFCFAPQQLGDFEISKDKPYTARYRFLVLDGMPDAKAIDRAWEDFANPVKVRVID